ncbi:diacylglycerol kinase 4-like [Cynara cardunculus var. scolymus]|uniref:diacylglycerol kinase 4-like n=1 Tax=Cynara cardunculus var. scolymus TaxID=59895 RepID=UPI000D62C5A2|nr:diacylglycerol kinase 4-like [Cynara cardunculus var. scolymus]
MASSSGPDPAMNKAESKASMIESIKGRSMSGVRVSRGDLRRKMTMPAYLRLAIRDAIAAKSIDAGKRHYGVASLCLVDDGGGEKCPLGTPESPVVVFVNSKSGGRQGYALKSKLQNLMGEEQVLDLQTVKPHEFVEYGLGCLENFAALGDSCAKETRERLRIVVAGGDGTVGWVLGCLGELHKQGRDPVPPTAIIPLGTGNDLSRNFGWGGSFPFNWKTAIKKTLDRVLHAPLCRLDSWNLVISMPAGVELDTPHALKQTEEVILDQDLENAGRLPEQVSCYQGVFYNYFSIGMDAQVAYSFHHLRNEKPYLAQSPIANKIIYSGYSCKQGWFFTPCMTGPSLRGLKNILRLHIKRLNSPKWELIHFPSSVRSVVALNLHSYASGRNPWGNLKPEYLEKRGFVEAKADDGLLEIFGFKQGWHASFVMVDLISAKHIAQASEIRFELRGGAWKEGFMQMDGEPWKQPMNNEYSTFLDIKRVQFQSIMIQGRTTILE